MNKLRSLGVFGLAVVFSTFLLTSADAKDVTFSRNAAGEIAWLDKNCTDADCMSDGLKKIAKTMKRKPDYKDIYEDLLILSKLYKKCCSKYGSPTKVKAQIDKMGTYMTMSQRDYISVFKGPVLALKANYQVLGPGK